MTCVGVFGKNGGFSRRPLVLEEVLDHMERVLDLGPNARLGALELLEQLPQPVAWQRLALAALQCDVPAHQGVSVLFAFVGSLVARITEHLRLLALQQLVCLAYVAHVGRRRHDRTNPDSAAPTYHRVPRKTPASKTRSYKNQ